MEKARNGQESDTNHRRIDETGVIRSSSDKSCLHPKRLVADNSNANVVIHLMMAAGIGTGLMQQF